MELSEKDSSACSEHCQAADPLQILEEPSDAFHPLASKVFMPYHISSPALWVLPREIRDIIYTDLIVAGDLSILRTSKAVCQEAIQLLYKRGICRIVLDNRFSTAQNDFGLERFNASTIQHLEVRLRNPDYFDEEPRFCNSIKKFSGSSTCRQNCHITITYTVFSPYWDTYWLKDSRMPPKVLHIFRVLTGFKIVTISTRSPNPEHHLKLLQAINDHLEVSLGRSILHGRAEADYEAQYLEFHPRDHWEARQERQSSRS